MSTEYRVEMEIMGHLVEYIDLAAMLTHDYNIAHVKSVSFFGHKIKHMGVIIVAELENSKTCDFEVYIRWGTAGHSMKEDFYHNSIIVDNEVRRPVMNAKLMAALNTYIESPFNLVRA